MNTDERYISRCLELASKGLGNVAPNPMVGCVIVYNNIIIGEGYHKKYGMPHAEVNAINSVKQPELLKHSTLYVNLEPCSHYGKTPPCVDLIIKSKIPKVVIGNVDCNEKVCGQGIEKLKNAGCDVTFGVLDDECKKLNKRFFTYHKLNRAYVILKWAKTADGFIDIERKDISEAMPARITGEYSRILDHKWRSEEAAIMIGTNTAIKDNPRLNVRSWTGNNPVRIVIDKNNRIPSNINLFDIIVRTIVFTSKSKPNKDNIEFVEIDFNSEITIQITKILRELKLQSVIVEGGAKLLNSFISSGIWDEARVFTSKENFGKGVASPIISGFHSDTFYSGKDRVDLFLNK